MHNNYLTCIGISLKSLDNLDILVNYYRLWLEATIGYFGI